MSGRGSDGEGNSDGNSDGPAGRAGDDHNAGVTPRLRIVPLAPRHARALFTPLSDPRLYAFIPDRLPASMAELEDRFGRLSRGAPGGRGEIWHNWVLLEAAGDQAVGTLQATVVPAERRASIAYLVRADRWHQGLGREACAWLVDHLVRGGAVNLLEARIDVRNRASQRLVESLGFACVARVATTDLAAPGEDLVYQRRLTGERPFA